MIIFMIRQIIEKLREHQVPLNIHFIDFKAAFDTIWRGILENDDPDRHPSEICCDNKKHI